MPGRPDLFAYAVVRVVPRVERGEFINAGVVLFCRAQKYLAARTELNEARLAALAPDLDPAAVRPRLEAIERVARGDESCGAVARLDLSERFGWLVAPSSTVIQCSEVHTGLTGDPAQTLERLLGELVPLSGSRSRHSPDSSAT